MRVRLWVLAVGLLLAVQARAAGPRWVAGPQWQNSGQIINWYRTDVQYFVDAGPLSASVDHATAVALVDAAAAVWNVPSVAFTLKDGGALAEDVSSSNVYLGSGGPAWPADVLSSNYTAKQIAVVLDADGSITDMLLGGGASDPSNCRQAAVTESVDLFIQPGKVAHAVLVLNGRCTGPAPEQQLQMQYQLMRAFGRVIGIGWSQTNDNVFTSAPAPTYDQELHWPVMHPIDILCGPYTYQCLPQPFTLRDDDVAALGLVYWATGLVPSGTALIRGRVMFPDGLPMNGVNVAAARGYNWTNYQEDFQDVSGVSGYLWREDSGNPVTGAAKDTVGITGTPDASVAGGFTLFGIALLQQYSYTNVIVTTEAVNPLYVGSYAVGPYRIAHVSPSGSRLSLAVNGLFSKAYEDEGSLVVTDASSACDTSADGTEDAPATVAADGVWNGELCGVGHSAWSSFVVKAGRTATVEVTATDEQSLASGAKALPVVGLWNGTDATGTLPTLAAAPTAENTSHIGMTQMHVAFTTAESVRMALADGRGDGRPDYTYRARVLYADRVQPAQVPAEGGAIRIAGMGFAEGNTVTVGGVAAQVTGVSATEIDVIVPPSSGLATPDVTVTDLATGGTASIAGAFTYEAATGDVLSMTPMPAGPVNVGVPAPFALKVVDASGNAVANAAIGVTVSGAGALLSGCQLAACTLVTDANGMAHGTVTGSSVGMVSMKASISDGSAVSASWTVVAVPAADLRVVVTGGDGQSVASSASLGAVSFCVVDTAGHPVSGAAVMIYQAVLGWQAPCAVGGRCAPAPVYGTSQAAGRSDGDGNVVVVPMQYANLAAVTEITVTAGTLGEATATVQKTP